MRKKAIIFDLDGVIIHTDELHFLAWKEITNKLGLLFDEEVNHKTRGISRLESLEVILEHNKKEMNEAEKNNILVQKNNIFLSYLDELSEKSGNNKVYETLENLKQKGIRMAIGSSSKNARQVLSKIKLIDYFEVIVDGNDIVNNKPDPEVFLKAAKLLDLKPNECYIVEDGIAGIEAAITGGFEVIAVGNGISYGKHNYKIEEFDELLKYI